MRPKLSKNPRLWKNSTIRKKPKLILKTFLQSTKNLRITEKKSRIPDQSREKLENSGEPVAQMLKFQIRSICLLREQNNMQNMHFPHFRPEKFSLSDLSNIAKGWFFTLMEKKYNEQPWLRSIITLNINKVQLRNGVVRNVKYRFG